ncbi:MAG: biotin/lipoyl-containing protein, partial [Pseudomonadota bacterium]
ASPSDEWMERIRIDHGVDEGSEISMHYDPMIAKLISWGDDRKSAIEAMRHALNCYEIRGVGHNLHFLSNLVCHPDVLSGAIDTSWIERTFPDGLLAQHLQSAPLAPLVAVGALAWRSWQAQRQDVLEPPKHLYGLMTEVASTAKRQGFFVDVLEAGQVCVDGESVLIEPAPDGKAMLQGRVAMMLDGQREWFLLERSQGRVRISHDGRAIELLFMDARLEPYQALMPEKVEPDQSQFLMTPMPGILARMLVKEGELVQPGQAIAIVEAMKMENILRAKEQAVVDRILVSQGDSLETDQLLVEFARNA